MTTLFSSEDPELTYMGHPVRRGSILRHKPSGDVGGLVWASSLSSETVRSSITKRLRVAGLADAEWDELYLKVEVWRVGNSRLWRGKDVELVIDTDTDAPPERLEI